MNHSETTVTELREEYNRLMESAFNLDDLADGLERYGQYSESDRMREKAAWRRVKMKEIDLEIMDRCFLKGTAPFAEAKRGRERE